MGKSSKNEFSELLKWHERGTAHEDNRAVLTWSYVDSDAIVSANGFSMHVTWGDFSALADANGFVEHKKSVYPEKRNSSGNVIGYEDKPGKFPNWRALVNAIPAQPHYTARFTVGQMVQAVKIARVFSKDSNDSTTFVFCTNARDAADSFVAVMGRSLERGDAVSNVRAVVSSVDKPLVVALSAEFVLNALSGFADDETVMMQGNGDNEPVVFCAGDKLAMIMPMGRHNRVTDAGREALLARIDPTLPTEYNPPKTWQEQARETAARLKKQYPSLYSKTAAQKEADRAERDAAKARKARETAARFTELPAGATIDAAITHDPERQALYNWVARNAWVWLSNTDKHIAVQASADTLRLTVCKGKSRLETMCFSLKDGATWVHFESKYVGASFVDTTMQAHQLYGKAIRLKLLLALLLESDPALKFVVVKPQAQQAA